LSGRDGFNRSAPRTTLRELMFRGAVEPERFFLSRYRGWNNWRYEMSKKFIVVGAGLLVVLAWAVVCQANGMFVATVQNFRGALYQGYGPTPGHACENGMVKCSQDSFIPPSCKVVSVRMECPPPACFVPPPPMPMRKPIQKSHASGTYPAGYPWGKPMP
jgi:hypothetical protein